LCLFEKSHTLGLGFIIETCALGLDGCDQSSLIGIALAGLFDGFTIQMQFAIPMVPVGRAVYYLAWKHLVSRLNAELGIADA
jgi:hypothetical protein